MGTEVIHDNYVDHPPSAQAAVDLIPNWISKLPDSLGVKSGVVELFEDNRISWAIEQFGSIAKMRVLELGPLEAGHTYQLIQQGAEHVLAIEAHQLAFMKCLIVKELTGLTRASFVLGNFLPWLESDKQKWDLVWASGVLYHMVDPIRFLELVAARTDRLFLWTHYFDELEMPESDLRRASIIGPEKSGWRGRIVNLYRQSYRDSHTQINFCGGIHPEPAWLEKQEIPKILSDLGFNDVRVGLNHPNHPAGPSYCVAALRGGK